jgi:heat shock protein HslJ/membrane-bound inhibitor of C-type lysozyme
MGLTAFALAVLLIVTGCRTPGPAAPTAAASPSRLAGTSWVVEQVDGSDLVDGARATVGFDTAATRVSGRTSCNRYSARVTVAGETLRIDQAATTKMACPAPVMEQERRFLAAIGAVTTYRREGDRLLLLDENGRVRLRLSPGTAAAGPPLRARSYECDGGLTLAITLPADVDAVDVSLSDGRRRLPRVPAASEAKYTDGQVTFWSKGTEALVERDGRSWRCTENRPRSILEDARQRGVVVRSNRGIDAVRVVTPRPEATVDAATGDTVYTAVTEAHRLSVRLSPGGCVDSMNGERFDQAVVAELDGRVFRGCGQTLSGAP